MHDMYDMHPLSGAHAHPAPLPALATPRRRAV